jgi:hypothetical protein
MTHCCPVEECEIDRDHTQTKVWVEFWIDGLFCSAGFFQWVFVSDTVFVVVVG